MFRKIVIAIRCISGVCVVPFILSTTHIIKLSSFLEQALALTVAFGLFTAIAEAFLVSSNMDEPDKGK
jgi:hypothetical protein